MGARTGASFRRGVTFPRREGLITAEHCPCQCGLIRRNRPEGNRWPVTEGDGMLRIRSDNYGHISRTNSVRCCG
jgi:hypothetical protein